MAEPVAAERRTSPRAAVSLDLSLTRKAGNPMKARSRDLGTGGASVVSSRPLRIYEELQFDLELGDGSRVNGVARVLRQQKRDAYALRFERVAPEALQALAAFVESNASPVL